MKNVNFSELNVQSAKNFRDMFNNSNVYLYIGKDTDWTDEDSPDTPYDTVSEKVTALSDITYMQKISFDDTCLAIPNKPWQINTVYDKYSNTDSNLENENFFVITSSNNVYKCLDNNNGSQSTQVPTGVSTNSFITADGYTWKFMYNITSGLSTQFYNDQFIITPTGSQKTTQQTIVENAATYSSGSPLGGHGKDAASELFARYVMVYANINFSNIDTNLEHRKCGLIVNPYLTDGTLMTGSSYVIADTAYDTQTGKILTLSNHTVLTTSDGDNEKFQIVVKF